MTSRLSKYAERWFAGACSLAGALAHAPDEDERGWDYLVEFAPEKYSGHADTHPPAPNAFVQIKTTRTSRRGVRLKLSNALISAQSRQPWFVVLLHIDAQGELHHAYAVHVWDSLMAHALKAVRQAGLTGKAIHREKFSVAFSDSDDHRQDLVSWMRGCIQGMNGEYEARKKKLHEALGYEDGGGTGHVTIEAATSQEMREGLLGLGPGLALKGFTFTPERFGLPDTMPLVNMSEGRLVITPEANADCEIRVRGSRGNAVYPGKVFTFSAPNMRDEHKYIRFSTKFLHLITGWKQTTLTFKLTVDHAQKVDLISLSEFCVIRNILSAAPVDIQVWSSGHRVLSGSLNNSVEEFASKYEQLKDIVALCCKIAGSSAAQVALSVADFVRVWRDAVIFQGVNSDTNIRIEYEPLTKIPVTAQWLVYYASLRVGEYSFCTLLRRPIDQVAEIGERREVTCGRPELLEFYAREGAGGDDRNAIAADYRRHVETYDVEHGPLELGHVNALFDPHPSEAQLPQAVV